MFVSKGWPLALDPTSGGAIEEMFNDMVGMELFVGKVIMLNSLMKRKVPGSYGAYYRKGINLLEISNWTDLAFRNSGTEYSAYSWHHQDRLPNLLNWSESWNIQSPASETEFITFDRAKFSIPFCKIRKQPRVQDKKVIRHLNRFQPFPLPRLTPLSNFTSSAKPIAKLTSTNPSCSSKKIPLTKKQGDARRIWNPSGIFSLSSVWISSHPRGDHTLVV